MGRYYLRTPSEIAAGVPLREIPSEEELEKALLAEEEEADNDEDVVISHLLLAARNGDEGAKEELREFLGDVE